MALIWIINPHGKPPGLMTHNHKAFQKYSEVDLSCAELIEILTHEIPLAIEMHFKLKYKIFIIGDKMQEINDFDGIWDLNISIGNAQVFQ